MTTMTYNEAAVSNALVAQKDRIIEAVSAAEDYNELVAAFNDIEFSADLWVSLGYGYKVGELYNRVAQRAYQLVRQEEDFLANERKNSRVRASTERDIKLLNNLARNANALGARY